MKDYVNPYSTVGRKLLEDQQVWAKVKKNYYENKRSFYKEKMYTKEDESKEVYSFDNTLNLVHFLVDSRGISLPFLLLHITLSYSRRAGY